MPRAAAVALRAPVDFGSACLDVTIARLRDGPAGEYADLLQSGDVMEQKGVHRPVVEGIERLPVTTCLDGGPRSLCLLGKQGHGVPPFAGHLDLTFAAARVLPRRSCPCARLRKLTRRSRESAPFSAASRTAQSGSASWLQS